MKDIKRLKGKELSELVIEINKDIDRYQESVIMGLSAKQLIFSAASVLVGGSMVLLLYPFIGLTGAAYVAVPCVAPIAMGGFYTYNGMDFYEYVRRKLYFLVNNKTLTYKSTEKAVTLHEFYKGKVMTCQENMIPKESYDNGRICITTENVQDTDLQKKQEFDAMKQKTKRILLISFCSVLIVVIMAAIFKLIQ